MAHQAALNSFLKATKLAKNRLCTSDSDWQKILPLTKTEDLATQTILRQRYCEGEIEQWGDKEQQAAARIYTLLRTLTNNRLTGTSETLQAGTFWSQP